nr:hypothetical protein [Streptomyces sp. SID5468]
MRALLVRAADKLNEVGEAQLAEAVRQVLPPVTYEEDGPGGDAVLSLWIRKSTMQAAQRDASERGQTVAGIVDAGFTALLAGQFKPTKQPKAPAGSADPKGTTSIRLSATRQAQVADYVNEHADDLGWKPSPAQVAVAWLEHQYPAPSRT